MNVYTKFSLEFLNYCVFENDTLSQCIRFGGKCDFKIVFFPKN